MSNNIDYVVYQDTDSAFVLAEPLIKHFNPTIDVKNEKAMISATIEAAGHVQKYVNKFYDVMAKELFNISTHTFDIKQEVVSKSSFFVAKKRYAQWIINKATLPCDELEVKGLDVVRSSYPTKFRIFMEEILKMILSSTDKNIISNKILEFKKDVKNSSLAEIAKSSSVNQIDKWLKGTRGRKPFGPVNKVGCPAHVKAAIAYNDFIDYYNLTDKYEKIRSGEKAKWCYLKPNQFCLDGLSFKGFSDPPEVMDFIEKFCDKDKIFEKELENKLQDFYNALKWEFPSEHLEIAKEFFDF